MKKGLRLVAALLLVLMLTSGLALAEGERQYTIGFVAISFGEGYNERLKNQMIASAATYPGLTVEALNGRSDPAGIIEAIETFKGKGVDAIIVQSIGNVPDACLWTNEANVPLVFCNILPVITETTKDLKYYYVGPNEHEVGAQQAEDLAAGLGEGANVCVLMLPLGSENQIARLAGFEDWMAEDRPDIHIIDKQSVQMMDAANAMNITEDWIQRFGVDGIDAINTQMDIATLGVVEVLKSHDPDKRIKVSGASCPPDYFNWIDDGSLFCDLYQNPVAEASTAIDTVYKMLTGAETEIAVNEGSHVYVPLTPVTKDTIEAVRELAVE